MRLPVFTFKQLAAGAVATAGLVVILADRAPAATRSLGEWDDTTTMVNHVCLGYLPDGGAGARVQASALLVDGGVGPNNSKYFELSGTARTTALQVLGVGRQRWEDAQ
jgi:hypothetical protein